MSLQCGDWKRRSSTPSGSREEGNTLEDRGDPHQTVKNCSLMSRMLVLKFGDHQHPP